MASAATQQLQEIVILRNQNRMTHSVLRRNTEGVNHLESLVEPRPAGNSMNWIVGHLVCVYNNVLPAIGEQSVLDPAKLHCYDRGSASLQESEAIDFESLLAALDQAVTRFDAGLAKLTPETLDEKAPFSPSNNPEETVRSVMGVVLFHQAYHAGQTGILRRIVGKPGAIR